jgi:hypothetical protein
VEDWTANPEKKGKEGQTVRKLLYSMSQSVQSAILSSPEADPASRKRMVSKRRELGFTTGSQVGRCMNGAVNMSRMQRSSRKAHI